MPTDCSPLSVALAGASSPLGEPLLTLTSIHLVSTRRASLLPKVNSSCLHTENLSYTHPNAISKIKKYTVIGVFPKIKYHVIIPVETTGSRFSYSLVSGGDVMTVYEALSLMIAFASLVVLILSYRK